MATTAVRVQVEAAAATLVGRVAGTVTPGRRSRVARVVLPSGTALGAALVAAGGRGWWSLSPSWFGSDTVLGTTRVGAALSHAVTVTGVVLLVAGWLGAGLLVAAGRLRTRGLLAVVTAATVPLLAGPPLFSSDAVTYVALGRLIERGGDPYRLGWGALGGAAEYGGRAGITWAGQPSPYSPMALRGLQLVAHLAGGDPDRGALFLRVGMVLALAATAALVVGAARGTGSRPEGALWLAVANPVVLFAGVSGCHLDALLAPLVTGAVVLARGGRPLWAGTLVGIGGQVKVTALAVAAVTVASAVLRGRDRASLVRAGGLAAAAASAFTLLTLVSGLGWGWVHHLGVPGLANSRATPVNAFYDLLFHAGLTSRVGTETVSGAPPGAKHLVVAIAAVVALVLVVRLRGVDPAETTAWVLLVAAVLGAAFWPWYLLPPLAVLVVAAPRQGTGWARASLVVIGVTGSVGIIPGPPVAAATPQIAYDLAVLGAYAFATLLAFGSRPAQVARHRVRSVPARLGLTTPD